MFYREYPPPPELREHVQCFWALEHDYRDSFHPHEHLWADAHIELIFSYGERYYCRTGDERSVLPENFIIGPFKKELLLYSDGLTGFVAVRFHPWGFAAFSAQKMTALIDTIQPVEDVLGDCPNLPGRPVTGELTAHLEILGRWFCRRLQEVKVVGTPVAGPSVVGTPVAAIARKIQACKGMLKIGALAEEFGINPRRLERLFLQETGLPAKMFARILRFNHAKGLIEQNPEISLASLTYETGYSDQAHFSRNFREMFGYTPAEFKKLVRQWNEKMGSERPDVVFLQDNQ